MKTQLSPKRVLPVLLDMTFAPLNKLLFRLAVKLWSLLVSAGWFLITLTEELPQDPDLLGKIQSTSEQELSTKIIEDKSKLSFSIMELKTLKSSKNVVILESTTESRKLSLRKSSQLKSSKFKILMRRSVEKEDSEAQESKRKTSTLNKLVPTDSLNYFFVYEFIFKLTSFFISLNLE